jgi:hypothetical protein
MQVFVCGGHRTPLEWCMQHLLTAKKTNIRLCLYQWCMLRCIHRIEAVYVRFFEVVRQQLDLPSFSFFPPLKKHVSPTKIKSCPQFSSYFNCIPYSCDCSLFVLIFILFSSISSLSILSCFVLI